MNLPDINKLETKWEECQSKDPKPDGYAAIFVENSGGLRVHFFVDSLDEWNEL